jgi:RNA polymerase sigma-70 factor (ECF subfamily)
VRGARGLRDEFSTFHASAYPQLAAQTLAITGDAGITRAAAAATLMRVWRSWPSLRGTADVLVRARWTAVLVAAERESTTPVRPQQAGDAVQEITGAAVAADTVVVAALQRLPRVQRRALVLHYMGGVSVRHLSELSGSSAEHIELLLDDGFTALAGSLVWSAADD